MKLSKANKTVIGLFAGLLLLTLVVVLNPGFQRWLVLGQLEKHFPGAELERVSAGPFSTELRGLKLEDTAWALELDSLEASYSPWALVVRHFKLRRVQVDGLRVALREGDDDLEDVIEEDALRERLPGIFELTETGWRLSLQELMVDAKLQSPDASVVLALEGGGLAPGETGVFQLKELTLRPLAGDAELEELRITGDLRVEETERGAVGAFLWDLQTLATGTLFDEPPHLRVSGELRAGKRAEVPKGEHAAYPPELLRLEVYDLSNEVTDPLLVRAEGHYDAEGERMAAEFVLNADNEVLTPFAWALGLPDFRGQGKGSVEWDLASMTGASEMSLKARIEALERVSEVLASVGDFEVEESHRLAVGLDQVALEEFTLRIMDLDGEEILAVSTTQPLVFARLEGEAAELSGFDQPWLSLNAEIPVEWLDGLMAGFVLRGGNLVGRLDFTGNPMEKLVVSAGAPMRAYGRTLMRDEVVLLRGLEVSLSPQAQVEPGRIELGVDEFYIRSNEDDLIRASMSVNVDYGGDLVFRALLDGNLEVMPHALLRADVGDALPEEMQEARGRVEEVARELGPSRLTVYGTLVAEPNVVKAESLAAELLSEDGSQAFFRSKLLQPVEAVFADEELGFEGLSGDWLEARIDALPLSVAALFVEGWQLSGGGVFGAFTVGGGEVPGSFRVVFIEPLRVESVAFGTADELWLDQVDMVLTPALSYQPGALQIAVDGVRLSSGGDDLLTAALTADATLDQLVPVGIDFSVEGKSWPVVLFRQPLLSPLLQQDWDAPWVAGMQASGTTDGKAVTLHALTATLGATGDQSSWLAVALEEDLEVQSFELGAWQDALEQVKGSGTLTLAQFPMRLPLALATIEPMELKEGDVEGVFRWSVGDGKAQVSTVSPWVVALRAVDLEGEPWLRDMSASMEPRVDLDAASVKLDLDRISLKSGKGDERPLEGQFATELVLVDDTAGLKAFQAQLAGDLVSWFAQPLMPANTVSGGSLSLDTSLDAEGQAALRMNVHDFALRREQPALREMRMVGTATRDATGHNWPGVLRVELDTAGGTTDLENAFLWAELPEGRHLQVKTEGQRVYLADLEKLARDFFPAVRAPERASPDVDIEQLTTAGSREKKEAYEDHFHTGERKGGRNRDAGAASDEDDWEEPPEAVDFRALAQAAEVPEVHEVDEQAFWAGLPMALTMDYLLHEVIYTNYLKLTEVGGGARVSDDSVRLEEFSARFHEARITAHGA